MRLFWMLESPPVKMFFEKMTPFPPVPEQAAYIYDVYQYNTPSVKRNCSGKGGKGVKKRKFGFP